MRVYVGKDGHSFVLYFSLEKREFLLLLVGGDIIGVNTLRKWVWDAGILLLKLVE